MTNLECGPEASGSRGDAQTHQRPSVADGGAATHTRLDAAAQQAQADEERAIKKCPPVELGADKSVTLTRLSTRSVGAGRHSR